MTSDPHRPRLGFGPYLLDPQSGQLTREDRALALTPKAFDLLYELASHDGQLRTKEELLDACWSDTVVGESVLKVCIREIRKALEDDPKEPRYVATLHRRGYRFVASVSRVVAGGPAEPPRSHELVGRDAALEVLAGLGTSVRAGLRQLVWIAGEAGMGKTTLAEAFVARPEWQDARVAFGHCVEQVGAGEPYLPLLEVLSGLAQDAREEVVRVLASMAPTWLVHLPALQTADGSRTLGDMTLGATPERMLRELAEALEALARYRPLVLILEDLHWSDPSTVSLIWYLMRRRFPTKLMVVGTYRPLDLVLGNHPLRSALRELVAQRGCQELLLGALTEEQVGEYLVRRFPAAPWASRWISALHARTEGHPLFLVNAVDWLVAEGRVQAPDAEDEDPAFEVPESVREMIRKQVDRVLVDERKLLEAASVVGMEFSTRALSDALEEDAERVETSCESLGERRLFIRPSGVVTFPDGVVAARFVFLHGLYQNVLYEGLAPLRRVRLHARVAQGIEAAHSGRTYEVAGELASQFQRALHPERAVHYHRQAAFVAAKRPAPEEALDHLDRGLLLTRELPLDQRVVHKVALLSDRGRLRRMTGSMRAASDDFRQARELAAAAGDVEGEIEALLLLASALFWVDREACLLAIDEASARVLRMKDALQASHVRGTCSHWNLVLRGYSEEDARAAEEALERVAVAGDQALKAFHFVRAVYHRAYSSDYEGASAAAEEAIPLARSVGDAHDYLVAHFWWGWSLLHEGRWGRALDAFREGSQLATRNGHDAWKFLFGVGEAHLHLEIGDATGALALVAPGIEYAQSGAEAKGQLLLHGRLVRGCAEARGGRFGEAWETLRSVEVESVDSAQRMDHILRPLLHFGLAEATLGLGRFGDARAHAERLAQLARVCNERSYVVHSDQIRGRLALEMGDEDAARRWLVTEPESRAEPMPLPARMRLLLAREGLPSRSLGECEADALELDSLRWTLGESLRGHPRLTDAWRASWDAPLP